MNFSEKVVSELEKRGWSRSEAARRGGISPSTFDKVINEFSEPGIRFLKGIAQAFNLPLIEVVSWLEPSVKGDIDVRINALVGVLEKDESKQRIADYVELLIQQEKREVAENERATINKATQPR